MPPHRRPGSATFVARWNIFKAVREGTNESLLINFDMVSGSGADWRRAGESRAASED